MSTTTRHAYRYSGEASRKILKFFGLEDRKVTKIVMVAQVDRPVVLRVTEYAPYEAIEGEDVVLSQVDD